MPIKWKLKINKPNECWNYTGRITKGGYGNHKYYFEKFTGKIVPKGKTLDHLCKNKICANPNHLEIVTPAENKQRASKVLNRKKVEEIKDLYKSGINQYTLALRYGINQSTISRVLNGVRWIS